MAAALRVVIVDEGQRTLDNLKRLLRFESDIDVVATAQTALAGIEEACTAGADIVLMGAGMPDLDGIEAIRQLRERMPEVGVALMSLEESPAHRRRAEAVGAREYLVKPFSADELVAAIRRLREDSQPAQPGPPDAASGISPGPGTKLAAGPEAAATVESTITMVISQPAPPARPVPRPASKPTGRAHRSPRVEGDARTTTQVVVPAPASPLVVPPPAVFPPALPPAQPAVPTGAVAPGPPVFPAPAAPDPLWTLPGGEPATIGSWVTQPWATVGAPTVPELGAVAPPAHTPTPIAVDLPVEAPAPPDIPSNDLTVVEQPNRSGQVTVVWSGKGGVGKTTIAINLATVMVEAGAGEVALVDLDLQFGDVAVLLGIEAARTMSDIVESWPNIDAPFIGSLMPDAGGVRVLAAPISPELADLITPSHVRTSLELLKNIFDQVVIDASSHLGDVMLEAIELADRIILVTDVDIHSIKEAKLALKLLDRLSVPGDKIHLVCNRLSPHASITVDQLETSLRFPVAIKVPSNEKLFQQSIARAAPLVRAFPDSEVSQRVRELAGSLIPLAGAEGRRGAKGGKLRFWPRSASS